MRYTDNQKKFVAVANKKASLIEVMNGMGHCFVGLVGASDRDSIADMELQEYLFANGSLAAKLSRFPVVVLQAKTAGKLATLKADADTIGIPCFVFVRAMLGNSSEEQVAATKMRDLEEHDLIVACLWGNAEQLDPMLKKFSCIRIPSEASAGNES